MLYVPDLAMCSISEPGQKAVLCSISQASCQSVQYPRQRAYQVQGVQYPEGGVQVLVDWLITTGIILPEEVQALPHDHQLRSGASQSRDHRSQEDTGRTQHVRHPYQKVRAMVFQTNVS